MCGHWHRSSGSPAKSGARSASAVYVSNPTVYGPKSSKWPSYPSSATDSDAAFLDALGIGSPFVPGDLRVHGGRLFGELAHQAGNVRQAPVADETPVGDAEDLRTLGRHVARGRGNPLVLTVVRARQGRPEKDAIVLGDQIVEGDVEVGKRLEVAEAPGPDPLDHALVDEELTDGVEISAVDHARVVLAHDLLVLLCHPCSPFLDFS